MRWNGWNSKTALSGGLSDILYIEWKYFNIMSRDLMAVFTYSVGNPRNIMGFGKGRICASVYHNGKMYSETYDVPLSDVKLSDSGPDGEFGRFFIESEVGGARIRGRGKRISWDLRYIGKKMGQSCKFKSHRFIYRNPSNRWTVFMPEADVSGTIRLEATGVEIPVGQSGYCDGNMGKWIPFQSMWEVVGFKSYEPGITLAAMKFDGKGGDARAFLFHDGAFLGFGKGEVRIHHSGWRKDRESGLVLPSKTVLNAKRADCHVRLTATAIASDALTIRMPGLFPDLKICEQIANMTLQIRRGGLTETYQDTGFNELTMRA